MAASRAVYSLPGLVDPERRVVIRNAGGTATVSLRVQQGQWCPVLEGNATFVYRVPVDPAALARGHRAVDGKRELCRDEIRAYAALDVQNVARLRAVGIESAAFATPAAEAPAAEALDVLRLCREAGDLAKNKLKPKLKLEIVKSPDDLPPRAGSRRRRHSVPPGRGRPPRSPHRGRRPPG
jgi:hypothetical protein